MTEQYRGESIIEKITAKIHPADSSIPDCRCELVLTQGHLFVLEDNFDGTCEEHYILPVSQIESIRISQPEKNIVKDTSNQTFRLPGIGRTRFGKPPKNYLEIVYYDDSLVKQHLYFDETDNSPDGLIEKFEKLK